MEKNNLPKKPTWTALKAGETCPKHGGQHIIVEPIAGGRKYLCSACLFDAVEDSQMHVEVLGEQINQQIEGRKAERERAEAAEARVKELERGLEVAIVTMASVWEDDFIKVFGDNALAEMIIRTKPKKDFRVEELMRDILTRNEASDE